MKATEVLAEVASKLIDLVQAVVMAGWGAAFRLVVVLAAITTLVVLGTTWLR